MELNEVRKMFKISKRTRGIICALSGGILWGYSGTIGQYLFTNYEVTSEWVTTVRMICAGIILMAFSFARKMPVKPILKDRKAVIRLLVFSILGLMMVQLTYMEAIYYSNSATATALQYLAQALILIVTCMQLKRLPHCREWIALVLAVGGVFLLSTQGNIGSLSLSPKALALGLCSAFGLMLYTILSRPLISRFGSIPVTGLGMLIGGIVLCILTKSWSLFPALDAVGWAYIGVIVLLGTAAAFTLYLQGVNDLGSIQASLLACSEPVAATLFTTFWLKTSLIFTDYIAFTMIILMSIMLTLPGKKNITGEEN